MERDDREWGERSDVWGVGWEKGGVVDGKMKLRRRERETDGGEGLKERWGSERWEVE